MNMNKGKQTAVCLLLALLLLAGTVRAEQAVEILPTGNGFPLAETKTMTAWVVNTQDNFSVTNSGVQDWIREKTNIDLVITGEFTGPDAKRQLNLRLETEKILPDILLCTRWTKAECSLYGMEGLVLPLESYLESCPNWNSLNVICGPEHRNDLTMADGHIYCYGSVNECFHLTHQARMWVYQPWIDKLCGGELPETTAAFRSYLEKVAQADPNENGEADEIPLIGQIQEGWATDPVTFLSNAFVHNNAIFGSTNQTVASGCYVEDHTVHCCYVEDGYREALRYLSGLYKDGLLYAQSFTQNGKQMDARILSDPHRVGAVAGGYFPEELSEPLPDGSWSEWTCLPPLEGPEGTRLSYQSAYNYFYNCNGLVTRDCSDPETAVQLFDFLASSEGTLVQNFGVEGIDWVWCTPGDGEGIDHAQAVYRVLLESRNLQRDKLPIWPSDVHIASNYDAFRRGYMVQPGVMNGEEELWKCAELYDQYAPGRETVFPNVAVPADLSAKLISYQEAIDRYVRQSTVYFISGMLSVDIDWDTYLATLNTLGQQEYCRLLQQALDAYPAEK